MKERIGYIDLAAGIMTLWIILCHAYLYAGISCLKFTHDASQLPMWLSIIVDADGSMHIRYLSVAFPYLFFVMPWFFYKSGMFFSKKPILSLIQKDTKKLLLPFVVWGGIGYVIFLFLSYCEQTLTLRSATYSVLRTLFFTGAPPINIALWFLLTLFFVRLIMNYLLPERNDRSKRYHLRNVGIALFSIGIGFMLYRFNNSYIPFWIANTATGCCFFALGYWLRDYQFNRLVAVVAACLYFTCCLLGLSTVIPMNNSCPQGHYLLWMPEALAGIIIFMNFCKYIFRSNIV